MAEISGLGDKLHVAILYTVMYHFDIVAGTPPANIRHTKVITSTRMRRGARRSFYYGRGRLEDWLQYLPSFKRATRHQARTNPGSLLTSRGAAAHEMNSDSRRGGLSAFGVVGVRVSVIDDHISFRKERQQSVKHIVDWPTGGHQQQHLPITRIRIAALRLVTFVRRPCEKDDSNNSGEARSDSGRG